MKLHCNVEFSNRMSAAVSRRKAQRSVLAIGRQTVKSNELCILWQTMQNKQGVKYKIYDNIDKLFTKFINDGKATIRLIEPPHDLIIQSDAVQLKSFIHILKLSMSKKLDPSILNVSNLSPKTITSKSKTKVVVTKNSDYPALEGFPRTTEELHLMGLSRKSFDRQILRLQSLRILNMSNNHISSLPKELGCLPHLQELILSQNNLGKAAVTKWTWLDQTAIKTNLKLLDLSNNSLENLPYQIGKLGGLVNLKVSNNKLAHLPQSIGKLCNLKYLDVSKNNLCDMPGSMRKIRLILLDVSDNTFLSSESYSICKIDVPSLVECAARSFLRTRSPYDSSLIPFTLVKYLDLAKYCLCGTACFDCHVRMRVHFNLNMISNTIKSSGNVDIPFDCYFCSMYCISTMNR